MWQKRGELVTILPYYFNRKAGLSREFGLSFARQSNAAKAQKFADLGLIWRIPEPVSPGFVTNPAHSGEIAKEENNSRSSVLGTRAPLLHHRRHPKWGL